jgi:hypothetical protein
MYYVKQFLNLHMREKKGEKLKLAWEITARVKSAAVRSASYNAASVSIASVSLAFTRTAPPKGILRPLENAIPASKSSFRRKRESSIFINFLDSCFHREDLRHTVGDSLFAAVDEP